MTSPIWEQADKTTILHIKRNKDLITADEFRPYVEVKEQIPSELYWELLSVNKAMFEMEDLISQVFEWKDFDMAGHLYYVLRGMTHKRTAAKHKIAEHFKETKEVKKYGNGY